MSLREGDIPETVESLQFLNFRVVDIHQNALGSLPLLRELEFKDGKRLQLHSNALNLPYNSKLQSFLITNFTSVDIHRSALSGSWNPGTSIRIKIIRRLNIRENAFNYSSSGLGPDLLLEEIDELLLDPRSLDVLLRQLKIKQAHMDICYANSFTDGKLVDMQEVKIDNVTEKCFALSDESAVLSFRDSYFGIVNQQGIFGKIKQIKMQNTSISEIEKKGVHLQVAHLGMYGSHFGTLMPDALAVQASRSIVLTNNTVEHLSSDALSGIKGTSDREPLPLIINNLTVTKPENRSLALSLQTDARIAGLHLNVPASLTCSPQESAMWLVGRESRDGWTTAVEQALQQPKNSSLCPPTEHDDNPNTGDVTAPEDNKHFVSRGEKPSVGQESNAKDSSEVVISSETTANGSYGSVTGTDSTNADRRADTTQEAPTSGVPVTNHNWWLFLFVLVVTFAVQMG